MYHQDGDDRHNEERQEDGEGLRCNGNLFRGGNHEDEEEVTFGFPILDVTCDITMKSIPMASLPLFYNKSSEDPDAFLFEFDVLCCSYNYYDDYINLNYFLPH